MNVTLKEWNALLAKAQSLCDELKERGVNVKFKPYTMYDGRKGIAFLVGDETGAVFMDYYSGAGSANSIRTNMNVNALRIMKDCGVAVGEG